MNDQGDVRIQETIKQLLIAELGLEPELVQNSDAGTPLLGRGIGLDSVEVTALLLSLEQEFDLQIPDSELTLDLVRNLGSLSAYIRQRIHNKSQDSEKDGKGYADPGADAA